MRHPIPTTRKVEIRSFYRTISSLIILLSFSPVEAQTSVWTWISGDNTANSTGVYGAIGVPLASNKPGNRDSHSGWKDASGNFWIFGGWDINSKYYNDLWKYNTSTGQWTWMSGNNTTNNGGTYGVKGVAAASNKPGSRNGQIAWTDGSGNFWIYGGYGYDGAGNRGYLNDLWKYNPGTSQWTWVSGNNTRNTSGNYGVKGVAAASNIPGGRRYPAGWIDGSGNFWIFGGLGYDGAGNTGDLNDLWKYVPGTGLWTWISGDNVRNVAGVYGVKGVAAAGNKPGNRDSHSGWVDGSGNFWLFGGWDINNNLYNDLWKYNPGTGLWTWVSGNNTQNVTGVYGVKGVGAVSNKPGSRYGQNAVIDASGNFWIFAGYGYDASGTLGALNDVWKYNPTTDIWLWGSGDNSANSVGVYGVKGVGTVTTKPGGRAFPASWLDGSGNLWSFGGYDLNASDFNDLWELNSLTALPLRNISLRGTHRNNGNVLVWETSGEVNTERFSIERSINGADYTSIGTVAAVGTGNNRYSFTDYGAAITSCFYRIQVKDLDGQVYYSPVIIIASTSETRIQVFPNPAKSGVVLRTDNSLINTTAKLYDAGGNLLGEFRINAPQQYIDLSRFAKGALQLRLQNGSTFTIIKE